MLPILDGLEKDIPFQSISFLGLLGGISGKESTCQCRRHGFNPWVGKIPWSRKWQPIPVFLPENPMDRRVWWSTVQQGHKESDTTE